MTWSRRNFLAAAGLGAAGTLTGALACAEGRGERTREEDGREAAPEDVREEWDQQAARSAIRDRFRVDPDFIHLSGFYLASHPEPVREAIGEYRRELDANTSVYLRENRMSLEAEVREAAAEYLDTRADAVALTDCTTEGLATVYNGVALRPDQEFLTTENDHYSTHESIRYRAGRSGASVREIPLYEESFSATADEITESVLAAVGPATRVVAVTWVHSDTGLKIPLRRIADGLAEINADRSPDDRALLCVDGVHGLGVEDFDMGDLGCDFFMAGTHKWLFGPRGTGILWGNPDVWDQVSPTIPTFTPGSGWGPRMTPGGFKPFEHMWAVADAFEFHRRVGKEHVEEHTHALNRQCKEGLDGMDHVRLQTPLGEELSAGMICFEVDGREPAEVVDELRRQRIVSTETPYTPSYARLAPSLLNTADEIEAALEAVRALA